ncbi:MAG: hypothetical protein AMXMBFR81_08780 [Chthonomonas sp.]
MAKVHRATKRFWIAYSQLPPEVRATADRAFELLKRDPTHPSLRFKEIAPFWTARVGLRHRALAIEDGDELVWVWIGTHAEYDLLLRSR